MQEIVLDLSTSQKYLIRIELIDLRITQEQFFPYFILGVSVVFVDEGRLQTVIGNLLFDCHLKFRIKTPTGVKINNDRRELAESWKII